MFVYCIIAIELTVLYVVFWIVFLREPSPRKIRAELWGSYFKPENQSKKPLTPSQKPSQLIDEQQLDFYLPSIVPKPASYRIIKISKGYRKRRHRASRFHRQWHSCPYSIQYNIYQRAIDCQRWHFKTSPAQTNIKNASRIVVEKFLLSLNRILNELSVKVP